MCRLRATQLSEVGELLYTNNVDYADFTSRVVNPVRKEVVFEQQVFDSMSDRIFCLVISDQEWLPGDPVGEIQHSLLLSTRKRYHKARGLKG
jgi:hypothetical protein